MIAAHSPAVSSSEEMKDQLSGHLCVDGVDPFQFHLARGAQRFEKRLPRAKWLDRECKREGEREGEEKIRWTRKKPRSRKNGGIQKYLRMLRHISTSLLNSLPFFVYTFERHSTLWELWRKMINQPLALVVVLSMKSFLWTGNAFRLTVRNAYGTKCIHLPIHSIDAPQNFDCLGNLVVLSLNLCVAWNILDSSKSTIHCAKMSIWQHPCHSHRSHLESIKVLVENACIKLCGSSGCLRGVFSQCVSIQAQTSLQKKCRWQQRQGSENPPDMLHLTYLQSCWKQAIAAIGSKSFVDL